MYSYTARAWLLNVAFLLRVSAYVASAWRWVFSVRIVAGVPTTASAAPYYFGLFNARPVFVFRGIELTHCTLSLCGLANVQVVPTNQSTIDGPKVGSSVNPSYLIRRRFVPDNSRRHQKASSQPCLCLAVLPYCLTLARPDPVATLLACVTSNS